MELANGGVLIEARGGWCGLAYRRKTGGTPVWDFGMVDAVRGYGRLFDRELFSN